MLNVTPFWKRCISLMMLPLLVVLLTNCGTDNTSVNTPLPQQTATVSNATTKQAVGTPEASSTTSKATQQSASGTTPPQRSAPSLTNMLTPNKDNLVTDTNGLHIQENGGFHCTKNFITPVDLVLASNQLAYDQGHMQQLTRYISSASYSSSPSSQIPSSLLWVEGAGASQQSGSVNGACTVAFQITNTGSTTIQIPNVALRLKEQPVPNTFVYQLIDRCSLRPPGQCPGMGGVPAYCAEYDLNLFLGGAKLDNSIGGKPSAGKNADGTPCPELTLSPQQSTVLSISVAGPSFIYSVVPEFTVITAQGQSILALSSFASNLAFSTQFPCYAIKGNSFVNVQSLPNSSPQCI